MKLPKVDKSKIEHWGYTKRDSKELNRMLLKVTFKAIIYVFASIGFAYSILQLFNYTR